MKIAGVGVDIVEVSRIKKVIENNQKFLKRIFSEEEIEYCQQKKKKYVHFAVRFAAKEAIWKALNGGVSFKEIKIINDISGQPKVILQDGLSNINIQISLSHSDKYAVAYALAIK